MTTIRSIRVLAAAGCLAALVLTAPAAAGTGAASATGPGATALNAAQSNAGQSNAGEVNAGQAAARKARTEAAWATTPEVRDAVAQAAAARASGEKPSPPAGALSASGDAGVTTVRDDVVWNAQWYWEFGTPYVWSTYWTPCDEYGADCECLNRLAYYWGAGIQLYYTLQAQADTGWYTSNPRPGDLVFWDYDGDGWFGPYDHTGVYTGNGYAIHASAYWGVVAWTTVAVVSQEAYGTYYVNILG